MYCSTINCNADICCYIFNNCITKHYITHHCIYYSFNSCITKHYITHHCIYYSFNSCITKHYITHHCIYDSFNSCITKHYITHHCIYYSFNSCITKHYITHHCIYYSFNICITKHYICIYYPLSNQNVHNYIICCYIHTDSTSKSLIEALDNVLLLKKSKEIFLNLSVTDEQSRTIELITRSQRQSSEWYNQRKGRITASSFHDVFEFKARGNPKNLLKRLLSTQDLKMGD